MVESVSPVSVFSDTLECPLASFLCLLLLSRLSTNCNLLLGSAYSSVLECSLLIFLQISISRSLSNIHRRLVSSWNHSTLLMRNTPLCASEIHILPDAHILPDERIPINISIISDPLYSALIQSEESALLEQRPVVSWLSRTHTRAPIMILRTASIEDIIAPWYLSLC